MLLHSMKKYCFVSIFLISTSIYYPSFAWPVEDATSKAVWTAIQSTLAGKSLFQNNIDGAKTAGDLAKVVSGTIPGCDSLCQEKAYKQAYDGYREWVWDVVTVLVTEEIPGAQCTCAKWANCDTVETRKYECKVDKWLTSFQGMIATIVRWFVNIVLLLGVLAIVGAGILMSFGSESEEYTKKAKWWAVNIIIGLIILFTFRYILGLLAPWIYQ